MWLAVAVFNPLISLLTLGILPVAVIRDVPPDLLAQMGMLSAGQWLGGLVSIDATLVLSGAVLTGYVGVTELMRRMTLDRCLPNFYFRKTGGGTQTTGSLSGFFCFAGPFCGFQAAE